MTANRLDKRDSNLNGNLLVASPHLVGHPQLTHGVVLILGHSNEGAQGVLLNSQANEAMQAWCQQMASHVDQEQVMRQIQAIASAGNPEASEQGVPVTVCMAKPPESLEEVLANLGSGVRILLGRVAWDAGELEKEIARGAWLVSPASPDLVFGTHPNLWRTCVRRVGELVLASAPGVRGFPANVLDN